MIIRFFDKETLQIKGEFSRFSQTTQTKYINSIGSFSIVSDYIPDNLGLEDIICASGNDCETYYGEVTQIEGQINPSGETYTFKGREVLGLLSERIPIYNSAPLTYTSTPRETIMKDLITKTFISPDDTARIVSQMEIVPSQGRGTAISYTSAPDASVLDNALNAGKEPGFGLEVIPEISAGKYKIDVVIPDTPTVVLSPRFDNLSKEKLIF